MQALVCRCPWGAGRGLKRILVHARNLAHHPAEIVDYLQYALHGPVVLERMQITNLRPAGHQLVHPRAVLHRAGARAGVGRQVEAQRHLGQPQVVAKNLYLGKLWKVRRQRPAHALRDGSQRVSDAIDYGRTRLIHQDTTFAGASQVADDGFIPASGMVVARICRQLSTSERATARLSISGLS